METEIKIKIINSRGKCKGLATVIFDKCLVIRNIRIMQDDKGLFISMPAFKSKKGYIDYVYSVSNEFKEELYNSIINQYENKICNTNFPPATP